MTGFLRTIGCALILGAGLSLAPPMGTSQARAQADSVAQAPQSLRDLRDRIEQRYTVLPAQGGIDLIPKYRTTIRLVEITGGEIAVDGRTVTGAELRDAIGDDADAIARLSFMDENARRVLFGFGEAPAPGVADTAAVAAAPDTAAAAEATGAETEPAAPPTPNVQVGGEGDRVRLGGSVVVRPDERIDGDVVALGGSVTVDGTVTGDVSAIGGSVHLGPESEVDGDVVSVGGRVHRSPGAVVHGSIQETDIGSPNIHVGWRPHGGYSPFAGVAGLVTTVIWIVFLMLVVALAYLLARRPVERMEYRVGTSAWKAAAVGLAAQILFFPVLVLTIVILAVSVIGIPLLIVVPFAILALAIGILFGFAAVAKRVGNVAEDRFGWNHASPYVSILIGVGLIMGVSFFASVLGMAGGPLHVFAVLLGILGFVIQYIAWTVGFGVLLMTRFGTRHSWSEGLDGGSPAPPPVPAETPAPAGETPGAPPEG